MFTYRVNYTIIILTLQFRMFKGVASADHRVHDIVILNRRGCVDKIREHFPEQERSGYTTAELIAIAAFFNYRFLDENQHNFINDGNDDAKDYYMKILPHIFVNDLYLNLPRYCNRHRVTKTVSDCMDELLADFPGLYSIEDPETHFAWLYKNIVFSELPENHVESRNFMQNIAGKFFVYDDMPNPEQFCESKHQYV